MPKEAKVVLYNKKSGKFQKTDSGSGYPTEVANPANADSWAKASNEKIAHYIKMFPEYTLAWVDISWSVAKEFEVYEKEIHFREK